MSTLNVSNITDGTNTTSTANVVKGSAAAWAVWNGNGTVGLQRSHNVSSITDNGTGYYTANFTNAMPSSWYCAVGMAGDDSYNNSMAVVTMTTTYLRVRTGMEDGEGTKRDSVETSIAVFY